MSVPLSSRLLRFAGAALLAVLPLLVPSTPTAAARPDRRLHEALQQEIARNPDAEVPVIIQKQRGKRDRAIEDVVARARGTLKRDLALVNGFSARLPAREVQKLLARGDIRAISLDAPMYASTINTRQLLNTYNFAVNAPDLWNPPASATGRGVAVAVIDSGVNPVADLAGRIVARVHIDNNDGEPDDDKDDATDNNGHGSHVAGIIAGNGALSGGQYIGIAPEAQIVDVNVTDELGQTSVSAVIDAIQWVVANKDRYNIRVLNLSLTSAVAESYLTSPLCAAVEAAWFQGILVVVAAGNTGANTLLYPPANDPFVITVGASDTNETRAIADDLVPSWSAYGVTQDGFAKPDVVAPGRNIVSLAGNSGSTVRRQRPDRLVGTWYLRLSGTSMAAPVVSGIAALTFQVRPNLTPDQFKWLLLQTARPIGTTDPQTGALVPHPGIGAGLVDAAGVVHYQGAVGPANQGVPRSVLIDPATGLIVGTNATWSSATWSSATWSSATWSSATWSSWTEQD